MRGAKLVRRLATLVLAGVLGCATDGGVGGTGISTINGNLANGSTAAVSPPARRQSNHAGVTVRLQGMNIQSVTDDRGWFQLEG